MGPAGSVGPAPEMFCIFVLPRLDFLQFQYDCRSFSDKGGLLLGGGGGQNASVGWHTGAWGGGALPSSIYVRRGPVIIQMTLEFVRCFTSTMLHIDHLSLSDCWNAKVQ